MHHHVNWRRFLIPLLVGMLAGPGLAAADKKAEKAAIAQLSGQILEQDGAALAQSLLAAAQADDGRQPAVRFATAAQEALKQARKNKQVERDADFHPHVLDCLRQLATGDTRSRQLYTEILINSSWDEFQEEQLLQLAAFLDDTDPVVAGLAELAIQLHVQDANHYNRQRLKSIDASTQTPWLASWRAHWPQDLAAWNMVQVAFHNHVVNDIADLQADGQARIHGLEQLLDHHRDRRIGDIAAAEQALQTARRQREQLAAATDLSQARSTWLALRLAARDGVLACAGGYTSDIAYISRRSFEGQHNISGESQHQIKVPPGSDILIQRGLDCQPPEPVIGDALPEGSIRGVDLFYDADRFVFSYAIQTEEWWGEGNGNYELPRGGGKAQKLYEIAVDGSGLRMLSPDDHYIDMEPTYLPDGSVVAMSDRGHGSSVCGGWVQNANNGNLYRFYPQDEGPAQIRRISWNKDYDRYPHVLNNGQIGFTRWNYQEVSIFPTHGLWTIRPDGTHIDALYRTHMAKPYSLRDAMPIPGSDKLIAIATGHHHLPEGWLLLVDPTQGINEEDGMRNLVAGLSGVQGGMPKDLRMVEAGGTSMSASGDGGWFQTPWALSETSFLASHSWGYSKPNRPSFGHALYYLDVWGNLELLARDPYQELAYPMAFQPRPKPPILPDTTDRSKNYAIAYVADVYNDLPGVQPGEAKYIRLSQRAEWPNYKNRYGTLRWFPHYPAFGGPTFGFFTWSPTRVIGTVPVKEDGSAYFKVPPQTPLYFQLLDENMLEIRRERAHVEFQPGEVRGCVGCHEQRQNTDIAFGALSGYLQGEPAMPKPLKLVDATENLDFEKHIQPLFDQHCVSCHGQDKPAAGVELTRRKDGFGIMQSYRSLFGVKWDDPTPHGLKTADWYAMLWPEYDAERASTFPNRKAEQAWWKQVYKNDKQLPGQLVAVNDHNAGHFEVSQPREFGSNHSKLIKHLLTDPEHQKLLNPDEWELLVTWVDAVVPYSGDVLLKYDVNGWRLAEVAPIEVRYPDPWTETDDYSSAGVALIPEQYSNPGKDQPVHQLQDASISWPATAGVTSGVAHVDGDSIVFDAKTKYHATAGEAGGGAMWVVEVPSAGTYRLWMQAESADKRPNLRVQVNDQFHQEYSLQGVGADWAAVDAELQLQSGRNLIYALNESSKDLRVHRVALSRLDTKPDEIR